MGPQGSAIPPFRADGYLPEALCLTSEAEVLFRFGTATRRRRRLALRLRRWIELARSVGGQRLLIDGSFITAKGEPNDIDAVLLLPPDFQEQVEQAIPAALLRRSRCEKGSRLLSPSQQPAKLWENTRWARMYPHR